MKKIFFFTVVALLALNANAKIWRVNNTVGIQADFKTPQAANDSTYVLAGDTVYIEGSLIDYPYLALNKPLKIFGPGYFLNENLNLQNSKLSATVANIFLQPGSKGSVISGLIIKSASSGNHFIYVQDSNITIKNNYVMGNIFIFGGNPALYKNIYIVKNYILGSIQDSYQNGYPTVINIFISNNYIKKNSNTSIYFNPQCSGIINNNIIEGGSIEGSNFLYNNNILVNATLSDTTLTYMNNICNSSQLPIGNGNIRNLDMSNVFVDPYGCSTDGKWKLKAGSPALNAGTDGFDCGMFGGVDPYKLSGVSGPSIHSIIMPNAGTPANGINVTVKVKAN